MLVGINLSKCRPKIFHIKKFQNQSFEWQQAKSFKTAKAQNGQKNFWSLSNGQMMLFFLKRPLTFVSKILAHQKWFPKRGYTSSSLNLNPVKGLLACLIKAFPGFFKVCMKSANNLSRWFLERSEVFNPVIGLFSIEVLDSNRCSLKFQKLFITISLLFFWERTDFLRLEVIGGG